MNDDNFRLKRSPLGEPRKKRGQFWEMLVHLGIVSAHQISMWKIYLSTGTLTLLRLLQKLWQAELARIF